MDIPETKALSLGEYFDQFRKNIIGIDQEFESPYGRKKLIYADWTASGRLYRPIEEKLTHDFGPFVANTHTETTVSGRAMTGVVNKFQRILGLKVPESLQGYVDIPPEKRPVVFVSHMEHHSNQTSWLETIAHVEVMAANEEGLICMKSFGCDLFLSP